MRLPWSGGSSVHFAIHPWTLMVWTDFWLLDYGFSPLQPILYSFCNLVVIPALPLCYSCHGVTWLVLVGPPLGLLHVLFSIGFNDLIWSLDLYSYYFGLPWPITLLVSPFGPFLSHWASLAYLLSLSILYTFSNSAFSWAFTNSFELSWLNYLILHSWVSWAFHQPLDFLLHYFKPAVTYSYFSTSHNAHGFTTSFSRLLQAHLLSSRPISLLYGPLIHYSCHSGLMVFFFFSTNPIF